MLHNYKKPVFIFILLVGLHGCALKLVDDFNVATYEATLNTSKFVDRFYGGLLETETNKRPYRQYSAQYVEIETEIRSLYMRNKARPLNEESTRIIDNILGLWLKYKARHKLRNTYSDGNAKLERKRFSKMFISALNAEEAKKEIKQ